MIKKTIHYVWFGKNNLPKEALDCIASWRKFCPDYEIIEWNEENFDFCDCLYAVQAYQEKMWAFASDYARIKILHDIGGIYMDVDVELLKNIDPLLDNKAFMGFEDGLVVNTGLISGAEPNNPIFLELINRYKTFEFVNSNGKRNLIPCVDYQTELLVEHGLKRNNEIQIVKDITIYPLEYFSPFNHRTGLLNITSNNFSIHKYAGSWAPETVRHGTKLSWKYRAKYGVFWGSFLRLFPYIIYIIKNDGFGALIRKIRDKFFN